MNSINRLDGHAISKTEVRRVELDAATGHHGCSVVMSQLVRIILAYYHPITITIILFLLLLYYILLYFIVFKCINRNVIIK
jgi:hypothetical protein